MGFHRWVRYIWSTSLLSGAGLGSGHGSGYLVFHDSGVVEGHGQDFIKNNGKDGGVLSYGFESAFKHLLKFCMLSNWQWSHWWVLTLEI